MTLQLDSALIWLLGDKAVPTLHTTMQMALRATIIFLAAFVIIRIANNRFFAKYSAFDVILAFILGSTFSRAINGSAGLFETIATGLVLVGLHWLFSMLSYRFPALSKLMKGESRALIEDGAIRRSTMHEKRITDGDLMEALRLHGKTTEIEEIKLAMLERNGDISVIPEEKEPESEKESEELRINRQDICRLCA